MALLLAAAGVGALILDWYLAFHVAVTRRADEHILQGFNGLDRGRVHELAGAIPKFADPKPFVLFGAVLVAIALVRARPRLAVAAAAILLGANVTTQLLKPLVPGTRPTGIPQLDATAVWPSGHATASMSLALVAILVAPAARRPFVAAVGAAYALAVTFTLLVAAWHLPSDVAAGYLVAGIWTAVAVAVLWARAPRRAAERAVKPLEAVAPAAAVAVAALGFALIVAVARPEKVIDYARGHTTFVIGAGIIAALALVLAAAFAVALTSGSGRAPTAAPRPGSRRGRG